MFRNRSFRTKLALAIAPPLVVLAALVATVVRPRVDEAREAAHKKNEAELATADMQLRDELQYERDATIRSIAARSGDPVDLAQVRSATDGARGGLVQAIASFGDVDADEQAPLAIIERALADLDALRAQIDTGTVGPLQVFVGYEDLVEKHLALSLAIADSASDPALVRRGQAAVDYMRYKNAVARSNAFIGLRLESGTLTQTDLLQIAADRAVADQYRAQFLRNASGDAAIQEELYRVDPKVTRAAELRDDILLAGSRNRTPAVSPNTWWIAAQGELDAMDAVEDHSFQDLVQVAQTLQDDARRDSTLYLSVLGIGVILAALTALAFARSMSSRISRVSEQAHEIASDRLPEVLDALRNPSPEVLAQALPQVRADSKDEIGSLAASFNAVLRTSVETSIAHAQRRSRTLTNILVNLGRRNQALIDRQLELIDELESTQRDPEVLRGLFQLDHMVTSLRRNAENLLVLASDTQARAWSAPVPMIDVVRGAVAEVEDMARIALELDLADSSLIGGRYAVDLSHLLAELVDNALAFSPPTTPVQLRAERTPTHFRVWILDSGLGMGETDLAAANQRVSNPPDVDELSADRIGFQVVGRLALRLGVGVRLQPNPGGGIAASVTVPVSLLEPEPQFDDLLPVPPAPRTMRVDDADAHAARDAVAAAWASLADGTDELFAAETSPSADVLDEPTRIHAVASDGVVVLHDDVTAAAAPVVADAVVVDPVVDPVVDEVDATAAVEAPDAPALPDDAPAVRLPLQRRIPAVTPPTGGLAGLNRPTWLDDAPPAHDGAVEAPAPAALVVDAPIPAPAPDPVTASGLQRRVPGQAFVGEAKAQQFDSGQFRRLPMPGDRGGEGNTPRVDEVALAEQRLRAMSGLQSGAGRARGGEDGAGSDAASGAGAEAQR